MPVHILSQQQWWTVHQNVSNAFWYFTTQSAHGVNWPDVPFLIGQVHSGWYGCLLSSITPAWIGVPPPPPPSLAKKLCSLSWLCSNLVDSRRLCYPWYSTFSLSLSPTAFLRCCFSWCPLIFFSGTWCELHNGSGVAKVRLVPSSSANLCSSFTSEEKPFSHVLSSNIRTVLIITSEFPQSFKVTLIWTLVLQTWVHDPLYLSPDTAPQWS